MIRQIRIQFWQSGFLRDKRKERRMKRKEEHRGEEEEEAKNRKNYCIVCAQSIIVDICGIAHIKSRRREALTTTRLEQVEVKANIGAKTRFHPFVFTTPTGKYKS